MEGWSGGVLVCRVFVDTVWSKAMGGGRGERGEWSSRGVATIVQHRPACLLRTIKLWRRRRRMKE